MCRTPCMSGTSQASCIAVSVDGHCRSKESFMGAHAKFKIRVQNGWSTTIVKRRYSEFASLDQQLRPEMSSLPELPPKDFLKKVSASLMNDRSFMNDREDGLGELLKAMVVLDPALRNPELREFLGVTCCPVGLADLVNAEPA